MTFSEFETRLNYYFNSTSERDVYALEKIFDGEVYPTMTTEEKKELHNRNYFLSFHSEKFCCTLLATLIDYLL